jgi:GNAT superfamily N-acetyltransferase
MIPSPSAPAPVFQFDDRGVTVAELEMLLDAMNAAEMRFPAAAVFHRSLRTQEKEAASLAHTLSCTLRHEGTLVGFLRIITDHAYFYYLCDVMVRPDWQGRGLGTRLVEASVQECRRRGYMKIFLTALPGLEAFYQQFGFRSTLSPVLTLRGEDEPNYPPLPPP